MDFTFTEKQQKANKSKTYKFHSTKKTMIKKLKYEALIFDFDGVIHNTKELSFEIYKKLAKNPKTEIEDWAEEMFSGNSLREMDIENPIREKHTKFRELERKHFEKLKINPSIKRELDYFSKNRTLFVVSSNSKKNLEIYFKNNYINKYFKEILAEETHTSKTRKFKIIFEKYSLNENKALFITDTLGDLIEANEVGLNSIGCSFGFHSKELLQKGNPIAIVEKFEDIKEQIAYLERKLNV